MPRRFSRLTILGILIVVTMLATNASAIGIATIVLKNGDTFERVGYEINTEYKILEIFPSEGERQKISYHQIAQILDINGVDITEEVLGGKYEPPKWESEDERDSLIAVARQKPWGIGFVVGGNYDIPLSSYYEGIESGLGFGGDLLIPVSSDIVLRASVNLTGLGLDDNELALIAPAGVEIDFTAMRYIFSVDYLFARDAVFDMPNFWHVYTGFGAVSHKLSVTADAGTGSVSAEDTQTKFASDIGLGVLMKVGKNVGIDLCLEWDIVFIGTREDAGDFTLYYNRVQTASIISFKAGIAGLF